LGLCPKNQNSIEEIIVMTLARFAIALSFIATSVSAHTETMSMMRSQIVDDAAWG
jgi:hypothetical protein